MTEEEAKTKWCPHVRFSACDDSDSSNRDQVSTNTDVVGLWNNCIASDCMMWSWDNEFIQDEDDVTTVIDSAKHGRCGLGQ